jgi:hypothetical protein
MIVDAVRWPIAGTASGSVAADYFVALDQIVSEGLEGEAPLRPPTCTDAQVDTTIA